MLFASQVNNGLRAAPVAFSLCPQRARRRGDLTDECPAVGDADGKVRARARRRAWRNPEIAAATEF